MCCLHRRIPDVCRRAVRPVRLSKRTTTFARRAGGRHALVRFSIVQALDIIWSTQPRRKLAEACALTRAKWPNRPMSTQPRVWTLTPSPSRLIRTSVHMLARDVSRMLPPKHARCPLQKFSRSWRGHRIEHFQSSTVSLTVL